MRNGVFWLSVFLVLLSSVSISLVSTARTAYAIPGDICQMIVWDSTGKVLNNNDTVGGDGKFYALARVEDDALGFVGDFLSEPGAALDLLEETFANLEAEIAAIDARLAEIELELEDPTLTPGEIAALESERAILEAEKFGYEEVIRELEDAIDRFGDFNLALVDAQTGSARIRSYAEVGGFEGVAPRVYHRLIAYPGVGSQKIDHMFPDFFTDPDGHHLDSIRAWLAEVAGVPVPAAVSDAANVCGSSAHADGWKFVDLACFQAGSFNFSISSHQKNGSSENTEAIIRLFCPGQADKATISANPTVLETQPVGTSKDTSTIVVAVSDQFGNRIDGAKVTFIANTCTFKGGADISPAGGGSTVVTHSDTDTAADTTFRTDNPSQVFAGTAEVELDCSKGTPGTVTVTAIVERPGADINLKQEILLVGPTASTGLGLTLNPVDLECGEVLMATATAVDINGVAVSDGTIIRFTTDTSSGIIGGQEGAQGSAGTSDGKAIVTIAVSPDDAGIHTVIAYTLDKDGHVLSQIAKTFVCHSATAAAVPTVAPPATGTGSITPPNTGDAGLISNTSADASLLWLAGAVASLVVFVGLTANRLCFIGRRR